MKLQFILLLIGLVSAEVLQDQSSEEIDPIKQTGDSVEDSDQSKRTVFSNGNHYALEKHVKYHPSGYKYLLGYRPVKLQLVPMAKPLYMRSVIRPMMHLRPVQIGNRPVVSLVPPKLNPVYNPGGYVYNKPLPVNVPPSTPSKPWQHQGWDTFKPETDDKPFVPSAPLPEPDNKLPDPNFIQPTVPAAPPTVFPVSPTVNVVPKQVFNVQPVHPFFHNFPVQPTVPVHHAFPIQPVAPVPPPLPTVNLQPAFPLPTPIQPPIHLPHPGHPIAPIQPGFPIPVHPGLPVQPNINTVVHHPSLVPFNFLPGKLNVPVPNLGVLPLGSSVPVQVSSQHQFINRPTVLPLGSPVPAHFVPQHPQVLHKAPIYPIEPGVSFNLAPQHPLEFHKMPVVEPPVVQKVVPQLHQVIISRPQIFAGGSHIPNGQLESGFTPAEHPPERHHIQISVNQQQPGINDVPHTPQEHHNFQYFVQNFPSNGVQSNSVNIQPQHYEMDQQQHQDQIQEQQMYQEAPGYFQPGKTDLQIPEYLPEHPHFKHFQEYPQDNSFDSNKR